MFPFAPTFESHSRPTCRGRTARLLLLALLLPLSALLTACNEDQIDSLPESKAPGSLVGTWEQCRFDGSIDRSETLTWNADGTLDDVTSTYTSTNGSCSAGRADTPQNPATYVVGGPVPNKFGSKTVTAQEVDLTIPLFGTFYLTYYINRTATPQRWYPGDNSGAYNGSTPALRTRSIRTDQAYLRQ